MSDEAEGRSPGGPTPVSAEDAEVRRALWDLAVDAAGVGTFDLHVPTGALVWDDRLLAMFGYDRATFDGTLDAFDARLHLDDRARVLAALQDAIDTCGTYEAEYRVVRPDGTIWVQARGRALGGEDGRTVRVLGAAYDTTSARDADARTSRVLEAMSAAFYALDREWRFTYVNAEAERMLGRRRDELLGGVIWDLFPAAVGSDFERQYSTALQTGEATVFEAYYPAPLNGWYELRVWPSPDGLGVYFLDVTARRAAFDRARLLAEATAELTETLDPEEAVARLAHIVVPALGDWCIVTLIDGDGDVDPVDWRRQLRDVGWWHREAAMRPVLDDYARQRIPASSDRSFLAQALRTGQPVIVRQAAESVAATLPAVPQDLIRRLAPRSAVVQPMRARGRTLALLTLAWRDLDEPRAEDLGTLGELAGRAGLALDNARLYDQQRRLAEGLQRSLLTEPPEPDHMEVVVRYEPAAQAAAVGGDWYDAFMQRDGSTVLVIGDVVGHDLDAAAAMGQLRGLLRGIAATTGDGPAAVLGRLDEAMELLRLGTTATAVVARFAQTPQDLAQGVTRMRWSNAGHPPPVLLRADRSVALLDLRGRGGAEVEADLLLGIDPDTSRGEGEVALERPATVLLYTDGLVEQRGQSLDEGLDRLLATLTELCQDQDLTLDELCDALLARMLPARSQDDVALAALRLHPQDRPRPDEAGPHRLPPGVPEE